MADQSMSHENDRKLDAMLDAMLSAYSAAEPRPGLETRILANVKEQAAQRTSRWSSSWIWFSAFAMVAAVILVMTYFRPQPLPVDPQIASRPLPEETGWPNSRQAASSPPEITPNHSSRRRVTQVANAVRPPEKHPSEVRQEVFPSPSPLSDQEKLLLRYLVRTPREELIAQSHPDPPDEGDDNDSRDPRPQNLTEVPQRNSNTR